jgi:uroporphyrinogen decarboxylase
MRRFPKVAWQGNLDPSIVELEPEIASLAMRELLQAVGGSPGHIVNLGHGLRPAARPESVGAAIQAVLDHRIPVA